MNKKLLILIIVLVVIGIIVAIVLLRKRDPLKKFMKNKVFLDQNNAHGDVLVQYDDISPNECITQCENNPECGGVTWSDKGNGKTVCYTNKSGPYLQDGQVNDYAWVKNH